jgi:cell fate regulator YaaT (PSP1 superfamily)
MACTNCSTGTQDGIPRGCKNKGSCSTGSCNKLTVFDWLANMALPSGQDPFNYVEIRFKNGRKEFFKNTEKLTLSMGDVVATEASPGHDIGIISLSGELVKIQMKKKGVALDSPEILKVYRKASQRDLDIWSDSRNKEEKIQVRAREIAIELKLEMKISDIEYQGDGSKITFYYTASERVDFRQLIKEFARQFSSRIEMKQVGFRQEAARLGGIGSCGRELCCSTWLTDFRSVNTSAARYQQLSLNPQKLAGQCGKLKCCLNFELDTYLDALKVFPEHDTKLLTEKGAAVCQKLDIFKNYMWFAYTDNYAQWHLLMVDQVNEIIALNKKGEKATALEDYAVEPLEVIEKDFNNAMGQESLTRFDQPKRKKRPTKKRNLANAAITPNNKPKQAATIISKNNPVAPKKQPNTNTNQPSQPNPTKNTKKKPNNKKNNDPKK